jgi:hypothetical protein
VTADQVIQLTAANSRGGDVGNVHGTPLYGGWRF